MKKVFAILSVLLLALALSTTGALAGKPVDNDGDGYKNNVDCNDSDPAINPGAPEICDDSIDNNCDGFIDGADPTCGEPPVDVDGDGYDSTVDCDDTDPAINPGATEICGDGIDQDCSGADLPCGGSICADITSMNECNNDPACEWIGTKKNGSCQDLAGPVDADGDGYDTTVDCDDTDPAINPGATEICGDGIDQDCSGADLPCGDNHSSLTWADYPTACLGCHGTQYNEMANSTHYKWVGDTTEMANQNGTQQGKLTNAVNSYCINILGDWKICGKCHAGRGLRPDDPAADNSNIDCLACHNADYAMTRTRLADGTMGPPTGTAQAVLDGYVQNIAPPTRANCLKCHANAGGGDAVKRGDLSMATISNSSANFDVHMNVNGDPVEGDLQCQACHVFQNHKTIGRGSDLRPTDDTARGSEVQCITCHIGMDSGTGHTDAGANRVDADRHVPHVACQACHVEEYAKVATETHRDWRFHHDGSPADGVSGPGHPHVYTDANLTPVYKFWNRTSDNYLLGDTAVIDPATGFYPTSRPLGSMDDGKLYPFKYKTADQPMITATGELLALDTLVYIGQTGDVVEAIESGLVNSGFPASEPYEWVTTDTYQLLNHGMGPAANVDCAQCHTNWGIDTDNELDLLGYKLKGAKADICSQCHAEKNLKRDHFQMHNHINNGAGMDCLFCHSFTRQSERGGIGPCDANASDFVDNIPFAHPECN